MRNDLFMEEEIENMENCYTRTEQMTVQIKTQNDATELAYIAGKCKHKVWGTRDEYRVSAKSTLGLLSLDITQPIMLEFENVDDYSKCYPMLMKWKV